MPQLDLVTFPSQVFWLAIIFMVFYAFVSGHFVPLLHKIIQTRAKKLALVSETSSGPASSHSAVLADSERVIMAALDKNISSLNSCLEESAIKQSGILRSGDKSNIGALAKTVSSLQGRYLVSRGLSKKFPG
jgi:F-type H+-transporting ATPase subunit b